MHVLLAAFILQAATTITASSQQPFQDPDQFKAASSFPAHQNLTCPSDNFPSDEDEHVCVSSKPLYSPAALRALEDALFKKGPWTSKPHCIPQDRTLVEEGDPDPEPLCVFNDNKFASNRGISIISTPNIAEGMLKSEAYTNPSALEGVNEEKNPPFYLKPMEGRGIGAVANRTLHRGDKIFSYTPVIILHRDAFATIESEDQLALQNEAVQRLPEYAKNVFMALHGHFGDDKVHDIIRTNSFQVYFGDDGEAHNAVLPETSRFNHDCRPNAHYYFDNSSLAHHVHALRTIHAGEELTVAYTDGAQLREDRMEAIMLSWGFPCSCSACSLPPLLSAQSDRRLTLIAEFREHLNDYSETSLATPDMAEALVSLYEQERLISTSAIGYTFAAITHNTFGNVDQAYKWAALAAEYSMLNAGPDAFDTWTMQEMLQDPKAHWSYKLRVREPKPKSKSDAKTKAT